LARLVRDEAMRATSCDERGADHLGARAASNCMGLKYAANPATVAKTPHAAAATDDFIPDPPRLGISVRRANPI
jgi:hypothetical protein